MTLTEPALYLPAPLLSVVSSVVVNLYCCHLHWCSNAVRRRRTGTAESGIDGQPCKESVKASWRMLLPYY